MTIAADQKIHSYRTVFEEYWYDALGRRVLVRITRACDGLNVVRHECIMDLVRRTVWDGDQELWEVQMPTDEALVDPENDTAPLGNQEQAGYGGPYVDPNPFWGRVAYGDQPVDKSFRPLAPFTIVPLWDQSRRLVTDAFGRGELGTRCEHCPARDHLRRRDEGRHGRRAPELRRLICTEEEAADGAPVDPNAPAPAPAAPPPARRPADPPSFVFPKPPGPRAGGLVRAPTRRARVRHACDRARGAAERRPAGVRGDPPPRVAKRHGAGMPHQARSRT